MYWHAANWPSDVPGNSQSASGPKTKEQEGRKRVGGRRADGEGGGVVVLHQLRPLQLWITVRWTFFFFQLVSLRMFCVYLVA